MIQVACQCGRKLNAKDADAGKRAKCPACGCALVIGGDRLVDETAVLHETQLPGSTPRPAAAPTAGADRVKKASQPSMQAPPGALPPRVPAKIGTYSVTRQLGAGAMGVVYLAHDALLKRDVAIKVLPPGIAGDEERLERFIREAQSAANLSHANTVPVYQIGVDETHVFIVMEVMDGGSLEDQVRQHGPMPWRDATRALRDAAAGLAAAHEMGLVHRDIKPANLMRTAKGITKVADFGLARSREQANHLTQAGSIIGTPAYMAPEQFRGGEADQRSDLYALCCTYYSLLTGRPPFEAPNVPAIIYQHLHVPFPDPRDKNPGLPDAVCRILIRGTQKDPANRYQNAAQLLFQLDTLRAADDSALHRGGDWQRMMEDVAAGEHGLGVSASPSASSTKSRAESAGMPRAAWWALAGAAAVAITAVSLVLSQGQRQPQEAMLPPLVGDGPARPGDARPDAGGSQLANAPADAPLVAVAPAISPDPQAGSVASPPQPVEMASAALNPPPVEIRPATRHSNWHFPREFSPPTVQECRASQLHRPGIANLLPRTIRNDGLSDDRGAF